MKFKEAAVKLSATAHVLAWVAFLFLAFWPVYSGTSVRPVGPDGSGGEVVHHTATIIEINGWGALLLLLVPVALTAAALLNTLSPGSRSFTSKLLMWIFAVLLLGFCMIALASIGMFYLPAVLALLASATALSTKSNPTASRSPSA